MKRESIRWQLAVSYAGIALLATLALGLVLLTTLNRYYNHKEMEFMLRYGQSIQGALSVIALDRIPPDQLSAQVNSFSIFSQSRIQIVSPDGRTLADSGLADVRNNQVMLFSAPAVATRADGSDMIYATRDAVTFTYTVDPENESMQEAVQVEMLPAEASPGEWFVTGSTNSGVVTTQFVSAFEIVEPFNQEMDSASRSNQRVELPLYDMNEGEVGELVLSDGPAYSRQIVNSVAQAWLAAGVLAVLLSGLVGYVVSLRISRPVGALALTAHEMAQGNLKARAQAAPTLELNQLSSAFNHMADHIQETIFVLRRFVADAAHELKTPLTVIRTNLELLQPETDLQRREKYVKRAVEQVIYLDELVENLLDLSRLESDTLTEKRELVNLPDLIRKVSEVYAGRAEQKNIGFTIEMPEAELTLPGYGAKLELATANLLDNAIKFTPSGGSVRVALFVEDQQLKLVVEDTGIAIPEQDLPQIFNRFHRGSNSTAIQGSGLGLAIVDAVIELHNGRITVENRIEGGTRFTIYLPR
ncbi:MAG: hypothetical protein CVU39_04470 [Chloroflexi bacterium HGW-Chloroflexi-10]|nr:MAG: hypothetical protein CVU39_04470 [Chloroflexi bacterium HGW-Chloroflexi-10]